MLDLRLVLGRIFNLVKLSDRQIRWDGLLILLVIFFLTVLSNEHAYVVTY